MCGEGPRLTTELPDRKLGLYEGFLERGSNKDYGEACTLLDTSVKIPESSMEVCISTLLFSFPIYIVSLVVCCTFLVWLCVVPCISFLRMELETIYRNRVLGCLIIQPQPSYSSRSLQLVSEPLGSFFFWTFGFPVVEPMPFREGRIDTSRLPHFDCTKFSYCIARMACYREAVDLGVFQIHPRNCDLLWLFVITLKET